MLICSQQGGHTQQVGRSSFFIILYKLGIFVCDTRVTRRSVPQDGHWTDFGNCLQAMQLYFASRFSLQVVNVDTTLAMQHFVSCLSSLWIFTPWLKTWLLSRFQVIPSEFLVGTENWSPPGILQILRTVLKAENQPKFYQWQPQHSTSTINSLTKTRHKSETLYI